MTNIVESMGKVFFLAVGLIGLYPTGLALTRTFLIIRNGEVTEGRVIGDKLIDLDDSLYAPVFEFVDRQGMRCEVTSGTSSVLRFGIGERVKVRYYADSPDKAVIDSLLQMWRPVFRYSLVGLPFLLFGLFGMEPR